MSAPAPAARIDRGHRLLSASLAVLALAFSVLPPGLVPVKGEPTPEEFGQALLVPVQWPLLFLAGLYLLLRRLRVGLALLPWINWTVPLMLGWFLATTLWSAVPGDTVRRTIRLVGLAVCAYAWLLASWQPGRYWRLARYTLGILLVLSVIVSIALPEIGTHGPGSPEVGKWRGLTTNKNLFGALGGIGVLLWLHAWGVGEARARRAALWIGACLVALIGARSTSSLFATLVGGTLLLLWLRPPAALRGATLPFAITLVLAVALPLHVYVLWQGAVSVNDVMAPLAELTGKDATLSGRADLWRYLMEEIPRHPWLGIGHGAYWLGEWSPSGHAVRQLYWVPNQGHSFYLDLVNETGVVGVVLFGVLVAAWIHTIVQVGRIDRPLAALNGALMAFLLVHGLAETAILRAITPMTVLMFFAIFDMNRRLFEASLRRQASARAAQLAQALALEHQEQREQQRQRGRQQPGLRRPTQR